MKKTSLSSGKYTSKPVRYHLLAMRIAYIKRPKTTSVSKGVEKNEPSEATYWVSYCPFLLS